MDKQDIIKIIIVLVVLGFVGQMAAPGLLYGGGLSTGTSGGTQGAAVAGTAVFNATLRTYDPLLFVVGPANTSVVAELQKDDRVRAVTKDAQGWIVNVTLRDDVYALASELLERHNLSSQAAANLVLPPKLEVLLQNGTVVNASTSQLAYLGPMKIIMAPVVNTDSQLAINMTAIIQDGYVVSVSNPVLVTSQPNVTADAAIISLSRVEYSFAVPWENRSAVDIAGLRAEYGEENVTFIRNDQVDFGIPLPAAGIAAKWALPYVVYVGEYSAEINESFANMSQVEADFAEASPSFPGSTVRISYGSPLNLTHGGTTAYFYNVALPGEAGGYSLASKEAEVMFAGEKELNSSAKVAIQGVAIGGRIVRITGISEAG